MKHLHRSPFLAENIEPRIRVDQEDWSQKTISRFERLVQCVLSYYREHRFEYIKTKPYYALSRKWADVIQDEFPKLYWKNMIEFAHQEARKRLIQEWKIQAQEDYEWLCLPQKFSKLTYQQIVDTLLWYIQYSSEEERELVMEFLITDGRCWWGWKEFNERNRKVQVILTEVANSRIAQQFPKE